MSTRHGISVTLDPAFTAGLHRARQVICSQYGCWAAEMHSVHLPLTGYFPCPEEEVPSLATALEKVAGDFRNEYPDAHVIRSGTLANTPDNGSIYVPFAGGDKASSEPRDVEQLQIEVIEVVSRFNLSLGGELLPLEFALLQYSRLPDHVFQSAFRFAEGVVEGLQLPTRVALSELALFRYESTAAGEDWDNGAWAADLSWQIIDSFALS